MSCAVRGDAVWEKITEASLTEASLQESDRLPLTRLRRLNPTNVHAKTLKPNCSRVIRYTPTWIIQFNSSIPTIRDGSLQKYREQKCFAQAY